MGDPRMCWSVDWNFKSGPTEFFVKKSKRQDRIKYKFAYTRLRLKNIFLSILPVGPKMILLNYVISQTCIPGPVCLHPGVCKNPVVMIALFL